VFRSKSKTNTEKALDRAHTQLLQAAQLSAIATEQLRSRVAPAVAQAAVAATTAKELAQPRVEAAKVWAKPHFEHGVELAAPKVDAAVQTLVPKVDTARDKIVDDVLPRITAALTAAAAASAAAREEALAVGHEAAARGAGAKMVLTGEAVAKQRRALGKGGRVGLIVGLVAVLGAAAAYFAKRSAPKDDPWATPLEDPYVAPAVGVDSSLAATPEDAAGAAVTGDQLDGLGGASLGVDGSGELGGTASGDGDQREPGQRS
jgi:hypothetical protein